MAKQSRNIHPFCTFVLLFFCAGLFASGMARHALAGDDDGSVTLVFVSHLADIQRGGDKGGLPELAGLLGQLRGEGKNVVLIHGGNSLGPSIMSSLDKGAHMIGLLNQLEPDAMGLGKRDFMHQEAELALRANEAAFPLTTTNIIETRSGKAPPGLSKTSVINTAGRRIGVCSLVSPAFLTTYVEDGITRQGGFNLIGKLSRSLLREKGVEYVIALADYSPKDPRQALEDSDADILYVSAAPQTRFKRVFDKLWILHESEHDAVIVELLPKPKPVAVGTSPFVIGETRVVKLLEYPRDERLSQDIERYVSYLDRLMSVEVGVTRTALDTRVPALRDGENAFANLVADSLRDYYGADAALVHAGAIKGDHVYKAGSVITRGDLQSELPFRDKSCLVEISGRQLWTALEHGLAGLDNENPRLLHVSGLEYVYVKERPVGSRLTLVKVGGQGLVATKRYTVALPSHLSKGVEGFSMFGPCMRDAPRPSLDLVEIVRAYIDKHRPVAPALEGRILRRSE